MRPPFRAATALLFSAALSTAAVADTTVDPAKPHAAAPGPAVKAAVAAPAHLTHTRLLARRAALRRHLALVHRRPTPVRMAALDVLPPPRPARLVDMTVQRDGVVVRPDTVQVAKPVAQNSACDSLLCSSYIILGAGF